MPRSGMSVPASSRAGFTRDELGAHAHAHAHARERRLEKQRPVRAQGAELAEPPAPRRGGVPGRQTVTISGQGAEGYAARNGTRASAAQRHSQLRRHERAGFRPDRVAMWAVLLGVTLMLMAAVSSHAAGLAVHHVLLTR